MSLLWSFSNTNILHNQIFFRLYQLVPWSRNVLNRFSGREWPPEFLDYAYQYFRYPGGTTIEGVSDKFLADHKDLQEKGMSLEEIVKIYVGTKIDAFGLKIKAAINNDINPKGKLVLFTSPLYLILLLLLLTVA